MREFEYKAYDKVVHKFWHISGWVVLDPWRCFDANGKEYHVYKIFFGKKDPADPFFRGGFSDGTLEYLTEFELSPDDKDK